MARVPRTRATGSVVESRPAFGQYPRMIDSAWPFLALMLLCAGVFPTIERTWGGRVFKVLPPIVITYLLLTTLAVARVWSRSPAVGRKRSRE